MGPILKTSRIQGRYRKSTYQFITFVDLKTAGQQVQRYRCQMPIIIHKISRITIQNRDKITNNNYKIKITISDDSL